MRPFQIFVFAICCCLSACQSAPPAIGKNLGGGSSADVSRAFDARVRSRFPVGSSEADMVAELEREEFKTVSQDKLVSRYPFKAYRDRPGLPCRQVWTIRWNSEVGKIIDIEGAYSATCL